MALFNRKVTEGVKVPILVSPVLAHLETSWQLGQAQAAQAHNARVVLSFFLLLCARSAKREVHSQHI